jgi:hypothetical protein
MLGIQKEGFQIRLRKSVTKDDASHLTFIMPYFEISYGNRKGMQESPGIRVG